jgi:hypothetical protein
MSNQWCDDSDWLAAGAVCPAPQCGEIAFAYHLASHNLQSTSEPWTFTCSRCGLDFALFEDDLIFHSVRREWVRSGHHSA